jgi:predicted outer membrane repeat protein
VFIIACTILWIWADGASARIWHISADGSGDAATIQSGLDSSSVGDTVLVACGVYYESAIDVTSGIVLLSETGESGCVTIDAQGENRVIECHNCDQPTIIAGFTFRNGTPWGYFTYGGGMYCTLCVSLTITDCAFIGNSADFGGGLYCDYSSLSIADCVFSDNTVTSYGGGLFCTGNSIVDMTHVLVARNHSYGVGGGIACGTPTLTVLSSTISGNQADANEHFGEPGGGGMYLYGEATARVEHTMIISSTGGEGIWCTGEISPEVVCCDIWGNADGDWIGCIADQYGVKGNFSEDPKFCDTASGRLTVETCSPCLPGHHPVGYDCGIAIGAYLGGCGCGEATQPTSWGAIKALYR